MMDYATLAPMVAKLRTRARLDARDSDAILALPHHRRTLAAGAYIVREGALAEFSCVLLSGYAYRQKIVGDGGRQIVSIHLPGESVDLQNSLLKIADHNVQALTIVEAAFIPRAAIVQAAADFPAIAHALWLDTLVDGSIAREWLANVGRRDARQRLAHLLCEFATRVDLMASDQPQVYELPMTQEQLGDALGLTSVHISRTIAALQAEGLIDRTKRTITIRDGARLKNMADFNATYLHIDLINARENLYA